jgi:uncharacterized protein YerC
MGKPDDTTPETKRIYELEDKLKAAESRIADLREDRDEVSALVASMREHLEESDEIMESWQTTFGMVQQSDGTWEWDQPHAIDDFNKLVDDFNDLLRRHKRLRALISPGEVGRPLGASEAQVATVIKLREEGTPYRLITDETGLSLQTVRTICTRETRTDRTTAKRMRQHMPDEMDKFQLAAHKARKRTFDALPKRVTKHLEAGAELLKAAKGLGKGR